MWLSIIRGYKQACPRQTGSSWPSIPSFDSDCLVLFVHMPVQSFKIKLPQVTIDKPHLRSNLLHESKEKKNNLPKFIKRFGSVDDTL